MLYAEAKEIADRLALAIQPGCLRLEIVGSVKRADKPEVHDIEMLVIPNEKLPRLAFGQKIIHRTFLDKVMYELCESGTLHFLEGGDKLRKYSILEAQTINPFKLELYIVRPETWGIQNVIRTGPSLFSHRFVTNKSATCFHKPTGITYPGLLPDEYTYIRGETRIMRGMDTLLLPEEEDAISLLGLGWIEPKNRIHIAVKGKL